MRTVSDKYRTLALMPNRKPECRIVVANIISGNYVDTTVYADEIISAKVTMSIANDARLEVGNVISSRLDLVMQGGTFSTKSRLSLQARFVDPSDGTATEWLQIGQFYIDTKKLEKRITTTITTITAYDKMISLDKQYRSVQSFPATMQSVLDELTSQTGIPVADGFTCNTSYTIDVNPSGYTRRQVYGFIASAHGCNFCITHDGKAKFKAPTATTEHIVADNIIDISTLSDVVWECTRVIIFLDDDTVLTEYDEDEDISGAISFTNPYATADMATNLESQLTGISYHDAELTTQGMGWIDCGDRITIEDAAGTDHAIYVTDIVHDFKDAAFTTTITSSAPTDSEANNKFTGSLTQKIRAAKSALANVVKYQFNAKSITASASLQELITIKFGALKSSMPVLHCTANFTVTAAGDITFAILYDNMQVKTFVQTVPTGYQIVHIHYPVTVDTSGSHSLAVFVTGTTAVFTANESVATVNAQGMLAEADWDGTITVEETDVPYFTGTYAQGTILTAAISPDFALLDVLRQTAAEACARASGAYATGTALPAAAALAYPAVQSIANDTNTTITISLRNMVQAIGGINLDAITVTGFVGSTPSVIPVTAAALETAAGDNYIPAVWTVGDIISGADTASDTALRTDYGAITAGDYTLTVISPYSWLTQAGMTRFTHTQLQYYSYRQLEGRAYTVQLHYYDDTAYLSSSAVMDTGGTITVPVGTTRMRATLYADGAVMDLADTGAVLLQLSDTGTLYQWSYKIVLTTDDLSDYAAQVSVNIAGINLYGADGTPVPDMTVNFERVIY